MRLQPLLLALFLLAPLSCFAENISLVCSNAKGSAMIFDIDTFKNEVLFSGMPAKGVFIDEGTIEFTLDMGTDDWYFLINRATGKVSVQDSKNNEVMPNTICKKVKPKS